ncbi:hypothetical protein [Flavobacterium sp. 140616W15]|uniref:hypothetical protein n=1 Tax=Flavobacterium sp. 140616W15 TaxID=2478552 RepID=UPI000F0CCBD3|nr:hypothetical protein [Flavobacterium sp. 140616W15]AYN05489.1 hypothetical protein EAG11_16025 [Flavobacterium sp. 140616W15]
MNYILNSIEDIQKIYTPDIEFLDDDFMEHLYEFKLSKKVILESMRFRNKFSDNEGEESFFLELSTEELLTGIKCNIISKTNLIHNIDYAYLLSNIDLDVFKSELGKLLLNQEKSFVKEIENTLENSNSDLKFNKYFKNKIENLIKSEDYLKSLIPNSNDFIKLVSSSYLESYSKTYNQLKSEYFDLLPQCFELQKMVTLDNSIRNKYSNINNNDLLLEYINDYDIFSLYSLEPILEGQIVTITFENPIYDKELDCTYAIDEIRLSLSQFNFQDRINNNYDENDFYHYACELSDDMKTWKFQKLNYEDFITYKNDFKDVAKHKLIDIENEILKLIPEFISTNIDKIENIKHLINFTLIKKWEKSNLDLLNRFDENDFVIVSYKSIKHNTLITEVMDVVYERKESFIEKIKKEFSFYYVEEYHETEFSRNLKKLDINLKTDLILKFKTEATSKAEFLSEAIEKLTECGFYKVLQEKYPEVEKQQSIVATIFRIHLKSTDIKYDIITVATQYYNFCFKIGLISHLAETEFKTGSEIAKLLNCFSKSNCEDVTEMKIKTFENNHTNRNNVQSSYYPFKERTNKNVNTILMKLNLIN